ncbi:MAG: hypothetical protein JWQ72_1156 [Polaromonas sp.]|nr:hypothetical protein [Polaromonas sp.]
MNATAFPPAPSMPSLGLPPGTVVARPAPAGGPVLSRNMVIALAVYALHVG